MTSSTFTLYNYGFVLPDRMRRPLGTSSRPSQGEGLARLHSVLPGTSYRGVVMVRGNRKSTDRLNVLIPVNGAYHQFDFDHLKVKLPRYRSEFISPLAPRGVCP